MRKNINVIFYWHVPVLLGETVFELVIPVLMANIIDVGVANKDTNYM